jgi:hypothetical protein
LKTTLNFMIVCSKDRIKTSSFFLFLGILLLLVSCRDKEDTVGSDFIEGIVGFDVQASDTATIIAYTSLADTSVANNLPYYFLGDMNDPEFGFSRAAIITQFDISSQQYHWPTSNFTIDSVVLQLAYAVPALASSPAAAYGNRSTVQTINVYELGESLYGYASSDIDLYSNKVYAKGSAILGSWTGSFDETMMGTDVVLHLDTTTYTLAPHMRIRLTDPAFLSKLKNADTPYFVSSETFQNYINGLVIIPETSPLLASGQGAMAYMNMNSAVTSVKVYSGNQILDFPISASARNTIAGAYTHIHNKVKIPIQPLVGGTHKNTNYLKSMAGLKTRILIPNLFDFVKDKNIAITSAEFVIPVDPTVDTSVYKLPPKLSLVPSTESGQNVLLFNDFNTVEGREHYGGIYDPIKGEYRFMLNRHIQSLITEYKKNNNNKNYGLNLIVPIADPVMSSRAILDTRPGKIKLKLSYTVIK